MISTNFNANKTITNSTTPNTTTTNKSIKNLTWIDGKGWEGVVYSYTLTSNEEKNGWKYVGCTTKENIRIQSWNNKSNDRYGGKKIVEARQKYGLSSFKYTVLERLHDPDIDKLQERLEEREGFYIKEYDSVAHGFNSSEKGTGNKGIKLSEEQKRKSVEARMEKDSYHHSQATKDKISKANQGKVQSVETRQKISEKLKGQKRTEEQRKAESDRLKGKVPIAATEGAKRWVKENGGGYWKGKKLPEETRAKIAAIQKARGVKVRAVYQDGTTEEFETQNDAAKKFGILAGSVSYSVDHGNYVKRANARFEAI